MGQLWRKSAKSKPCTFVTLSDLNQIKSNKKEQIRKTNDSDDSEMKFLATYFGSLKNSSNSEQKLFLNKNHMG